MSRIAKREAGKRSKKHFNKWSRRSARDKKRAALQAKYGPAMKPALVKVTKAGKTEVVDQSWLAKGKLPYRSSQRLEDLAQKSGYETYGAYIRSAVWKSKRREVLKRDHWRCGCGCKTELQVHHKQYPKHLGEETLDALETLCRSCHEGLHKPIKREANAA